MIPTCKRQFNRLRLTVLCLAFPPTNLQPFSLSHSGAKPSPPVWITAYLYEPFINLYELRSVCSETSCQLIKMTMWCYPTYNFFALFWRLSHIISYFTVPHVHTLKQPFIHTNLCCNCPLQFPHIWHLPLICQILTWKCFSKFFGMKQFGVRVTT